MTTGVQNWQLVHTTGSQIVNDFVLNHVETIYLETYELDQNWADHAVAYVCWDMIMNQWSKVFHLKPYIIFTEK
jgi:hypothetical protein